jgi:hypothetical protein
MLVIICAGALAGAVSPALAQPPSLERLQIGLLLVAIDAAGDYLSISEAMRVSNTGPAVRRDVQFVLPPSAAYVTFHRGIRAPRDTSAGFADAIEFPTGVTEIAYSYALPATGAAAIVRVFPLRVQRLEIIVRGPGVRAVVQHGRMLPPLRAGDQLVARWEVRDVPSGIPVVVELYGLRVARPWIPAAAAAGLAAVLVAGLAIAARRRADGR